MNDIEDPMIYLLATPITQERPWMVFGMCRGRDPELFFPESREEANHAVSICFTCPVRIECLEYSIDAGERFGIWGGLTEKERLRLKQQPA